MRGGLLRRGAQSFDKANAALRTRLDAIHEFAKLRDLPEGLETRMRDTATYLWNLHHGAQPALVLGWLPGALASSVLMHLQEPVVARSQLFASCGPSFVKAVVACLQPQARLGGRGDATSPPPPPRGGHPPSSRRDRSPQRPPTAAAAAGVP